MYSFSEFINLAESDYMGSHRAPGPPHAARLDDLTKGDFSYPDDIYGPDATRYYATGSSRADSESMAVIRASRDSPNSKVVIYRAVPDYDHDVRSELKKINSYISSYNRYGFFDDDDYMDSLYNKFVSELGQRHIAVQDAMIAYLNDKSDELSSNMNSEKLTINSGDWVSLSKSYAIEHGRSNLDGKYKIIQKKVYVKELFTDGDSINEFGWWKGGRR
ncbi:hypothetical protein NVP1081O_040 [Vibrio phage 1.081.O._10N.286.52.C2]|nr:hypothetical protein NVP1081O_040 [Vibrio phage 1.081.O._10N.286.52.C2]